MNTILSSPHDSTGLRPSGPSARLATLARRTAVLRDLLRQAGHRDLALAADNISIALRDVAGACCDRERLP